jgi:hypothetical protein
MQPTYQSRTSPTSLILLHKVVLVVTILHNCEPLARPIAGLRTPGEVYWPRDRALAEDRQTSAGDLCWRIEEICLISEPPRERFRRQSRRSTQSAGVGKAGRGGLADSFRRRLRRPSKDQGPGPSRRIEKKGTP